MSPTGTAAPPPPPTQGQQELETCGPMLPGHMALQTATGADHAAHTVTPTLPPQTQAHRRTHPG